MKCPHCQTEIHGDPYGLVVGNDVDGAWAVVRHICPVCRKIILFFVCASNFGGGGGTLQIIGEKKRFLVYPRAASRPPAPDSVPKEYADDYLEASLVISDSPKASAALSRRCLQHTLREMAHVKPTDLAKEIDEVIEKNLLPSHLASGLDAVRNIGNFAAHPIKSKSTGEVVPVEAGEAEWNLEILEGLFDFFFVQPAILKARKDALNKKLTDAGKPIVK